MNLFMIAAITIGLLAIAGIVVVNTDTITAEEPKNISCSSCGNSCSAESNCGLSTCGAVQGRSCGCRN